MQVEFYIEGEDNVYEDCKQSNIPRQGDGIVIHEILFRVFTVVWDYDIRVVKITLERLE